MPNNRPNPARQTQNKMILFWAAKSTAAVWWTKKVPACMSCHGPSGAGIPGGGTEIGAYPRLGGQHMSYVVDQMKAYKSGQRKNAIMEDIAKRLTEEELNAVSNFIQGLH